MYPFTCLLSEGQAAALPVQFSALSQAPAVARHTVAEDLYLLVGHALEAPSQVSARSHPPATARHVLPLESTTSVGQVVLTPLQVSARSQLPLAARHVLPFFTGPQVPFLAAPAATLHAWQSTLPPPQAVLQHTPSTQKPVEQSLFLVHLPPVPPVHSVFRM